MAMRNFALSSWACMSLVAAGCTAPDSQAPSARPAQQAATATEEQGAAAAQAPQVATTADAPAGPPAPAPVQAAPTRDLDKLRKLKVRTGGPLPPRVLSSPQDRGQGCRTDADCSNVGAGAGSAGTSPACGADDDRPCRCVDGTCIALSPALDPPVDPAPQPPEQR
ncbi:hypothetical protein MQC88_05480 [Luteimonas sp. 50]|uniref:Secreted protein n=1 Tax=Cognatiluteimonas sedimenti TaxID=2927791 RepID=A0ABT0A386_9GAMM|nr:hypothetical protein [Lysobacter sedimenti]MCJ0825411.1 hypothetical protein [Lysobacter sedimenti]